MTGFSRSNKRGFSRQGGLASIIIVFTLMVIVASLSLGLARLMNRSTQVATNNQLSAAADTAAQSGINDAAAYVQANPSARADDCNDLIDDTSGTLRFGGVATADLSGDQVVRYACVLIEPEPADVVYQNLPPYQSQVVRLSTSSPMESVMFSWRANDRNKTQFVSGPQDFLDETSWADTRYGPVLRISLFPVDSSGNIGTSKSVYLYPNSDSSGNAASVDYGTVQSGAKTNGNCQARPPAGNANTGTFVGTADYDCNTIITNLPNLGAGSYIYARLTPMYTETDVKIQANDSSNRQVLFENVQSVVDVTAKANDAVRRLQARVATSDPNNINSGSYSMPEDTIRTANTLCKRIILPTANPDILQIDSQSLTNSPACNYLDLTTPPSVTLTATSPINDGESTTLTWTVGGDPADYCTASGQWSGGKAFTNGTHTAPDGPLSGPNTYTYTITCGNAAGENSATATVTVNAPSGGGGGSCPNPPTGGPIIGSDPCVVDFLFTGWSGSGSATFSLWASHCYSNLSINGVNVSWIPVPSDNSTYYNYTITLNNAGGSVQAVCQGNGGTSTATISVPPFGGPPPPPPPPCPSPPGSGPCGGPPPPPPPYIEYYDCHPSGGIYWIYEHWSDGRHINTGTGLPNFCAI